MTNKAQAPLLGKQLIVFAGDTAVINESIPVLDSGQSYDFSAEFPAEQSFTLQGTFDDLLVEDEIGVVTPSVAAEVTAPEVVGRAPFEVGVSLTNTGTIEAEIGVRVTGDGVDAHEETVTIPSGENRLVQGAFAIIADTTFSIGLSGDISGTIEKRVTFGEKAEISVDLQDKFVEGQAVSVPYEIRNTGLIDAQFDLIFTANQRQIVKTVYVSAGDVLSDTLYLEGLVEGEYELVWRSPFGESAQGFEILKETRLDISADDAHLESGGPAVSLAVANRGYSDFTGSIKLSAGFYQSSREFSIASGESTALVLPVNAAGAEPGAHEVKAVLLDGGGNMAAESTVVLEVKAARFAIVEAPSSATLTAGEATAFNFKVKNTGNLEGRAELKLDVRGITEETKSAWIKPGAAAELVFEFAVPKDIEEKDYKAVYNLGGQPEQEMVYHVQGIKLDVSASLDKQVYRAGENAVVTLDVANRSLMPELELLAKAKVGEVEVVETFSLTDEKQIMLSFPAVAEEKLSYGIHEAGGRAIYLNSTYIRVASGTVSLIPDKTLYLPGDTVSVTLQAQEAGTLTVKAPGFEQQLPVDAGEGAFAFPLSSEMKSGTYLIEYALGDEEGSVAFDVDGMDIKAVDYRLSDAAAGLGDRVTAKLVLESDQAFSGDLILNLEAPSGVSRRLSKQNVEIQPGENTLELPVTVEVAEPGVHEIGYALYKGGLLLAAGRAGIDVQGISLVNVDAARLVIKPGDDFNLVFDAVSLAQATGLVQLIVDGAIVKSDLLAVSGYGSFAYNLGRFPLGEHDLAVRIVSGSLVSERRLTYRVVDDKPPVTTMRLLGEPGQNDWFTSDGTVSLEAVDDEGGAGVARIEYKIDDGEWTDYSEPLLFSREGIGDMLYRAVDRAGNFESAKTKRIKIDKTAPAVKVVEPGSRDYLRSEIIAVDFEATDAVSGVSLAEAQLDGVPVADGDTLDLFFYALGGHRFLIEVEDLAGNKSTANVEFEVVATIQSTIADARKARALGMIDSDGLLRSLIAKLEAAQAAVDRNQRETARRQLTAFKNEVSAQSGKQIDVFAAEVLLGDADYVINRL